MYLRPTLPNLFTWIKHYIIRYIELTSYVRSYSGFLLILVNIFISRMIVIGVLCSLSLTFPDLYYLEKRLQIVCTPTIYFRYLCNVQWTFRNSTLTWVQCHGTISIYYLPEIGKEDFDIKTSSSPIILIFSIKENDVGTYFIQRRRELTKKKWNTRSLTSDC